MCRNIKYMTAAWRFVYCVIKALRTYLLIYLLTYDKKHAQSRA